MAGTAVPVPWVEPEPEPDFGEFGEALVQAGAFAPAPAMRPDTTDTPCELRVFLAYHPVG